MLSVKGTFQTIKNLAVLDQKGHGNVLLAGLRESLKEFKKGIVSEIPGDMKDARRGIGHRAVKRDKKTKTWAGKAGGGVGLTKAKAAKAWVRANEADRRGKKGDGINEFNVHWFLLGTTLRRRHKTSGAPTGYMPKDDAVSTGSKKAIPAAVRAFAMGYKKRLAAEAAKVRRKKAPK